MECTVVIHSRRAVRNYTEVPVGRLIIHSLLECAAAAPSAMNEQPWSFAVCLDRERIEDLSRSAKEWLLANLDKVPENLHQTLTDPAFSIFHHAPALAIILATSSDRQAIEDCCLAAENLLLAARDAGLGSCWIGLSRSWLDLPSTKRSLKIPEQYSVVAPIILGHPTSWPETHERRAPEIHWIE